jgi:DNA-binding CsgD family transcriptional regulator
MNSARRSRAKKTSAGCSRTAYPATCAGRIRTITLRSTQRLEGKHRRSAGGGCETSIVMTMIFSSPTRARDQPEVGHAIAGCRRLVNTVAMFDEDIRVHNHRLVVRDPFARTLLNQFINRLGAVPDLVECAVDPIAIRREGKQPVVVRAVLIHGAGRGPFLGAGALLTLTPIGPREPAPPALLAQAFALTPAEARLAVIIAQGATPERAAGLLGISRQTARNQLKAVFAKTGTHRQSELVALLSRL